VKVRFSTPVDRPDKQGFERTVDLANAPRQGDNVVIDETMYKVTSVDWYPFGTHVEDEPFVYVVLSE
jgi:hypothetical protein